MQLPAELCQLHPIGSAVLRTGLHMPSVMRRIESLLVAAQLRAAIGLPIGLEKVGGNTGLRFRFCRFIDILEGKSSRNALSFFVRHASDRVAAGRRAAAGRDWAADWTGEGQVSFRFISVDRRKTAEGYWINFSASQ